MSGMYLTTRVFYRIGILRCWCLMVFLRRRRRLPQVVFWSVHLPLISVKKQDLKIISGIQTDLERVQAKRYASYVKVPFALPGHGSLELAETSEMWKWPMVTHFGWLSFSNYKMQPWYDTATLEEILRSCRGWIHDIIFVYCSTAFHPRILSYQCITRFPWSYRFYPGRWSRGRKMGDVAKHRWLRHSWLN